MNNYLSKILDWKTDDIASQYDELPVWSTPFGTLLLDNFPIGNYENYLDIGYGTGFPLLDISQRLGAKCKAYGIDPWTNATKRARFKIKALELKNVELIESDASTIPFSDNYFDLITSNLGINNFDNPSLVLAECYRVLKNNASLCTTTNLTGTFKEFFDIYAQTLKELGLSQYETKLDQHVKHRGTIESKRTLIENSGLEITKQIETTCSMRFLNGSTFLNHTFILIGFIDSWRNMFNDIDKPIFFNRFEQKLNEYSKAKGELKLTIPMAYFECKKNNFSA